MRMPLKFYTLMIPVALSAFTFPTQFQQFLGLARDNGVVARDEQATTQRSGGAVRVRAGGDGHFHVTAKIGARRVPLLVDTGATVVALTHETGRDLGLLRAGTVPDVRMSTANGEIRATRVSIDRLDVEGIALTNIDAVVMPKGALATNLLGMSYLGKLSRWSVDKGTLVLER